jgi:hypothetical protein
MLSSSQSSRLRNQRRRTDYHTFPYVWLSFQSDWQRNQLLDPCIRCLSDTVLHSSLSIRVLVLVYRSGSHDGSRMRGDCFLLSVCLIGASTRAMIRRFENGIEAGLQRPRRKRPQVEIGLLLLSMGLIAFSIIVVEYLLKVNQVTGLSEINAVGQLIPVLIGTLECASISWKILAHGLLWTRRCWTSCGEEQTWVMLAATKRQSSHQVHGGSSW